MPLPERRQRFIDEYLIDRNAAQAAIRAGYSRRGARQAGHRLLTDVDIASEIQRRSKAVAEKLGVDHKMVVKGFMEAIELAREKQDARTMLAAAKELAKVCGFYPLPKARKVEPAEESKPANEFTVGGRPIRELSTEELEELLGVNRVFRTKALSL